MEKLKNFFLSFVLLSVSTVMCAQTEIKGTVVDTKGETIIGATVMEKGTSNGTITHNQSQRGSHPRLHLHWLPDSRAACTAGHEGDNER